MDDVDDTRINLALLLCILNSYVVISSIGKCCLPKWFWMTGVTGRSEVKDATTSSRCHPQSIRAASLVNSK